MRFRLALLGLAGALLACTTLVPAGPLAGPLTNPLVKQAASARPAPPLPAGLRACDFVPGVSVPAAALPSTALAPTPYPPPPLPPNSAVARRMTERQLDVFQQLWDIVNEEYIDPDFNGRDWQAIGAQYRARIQSGLTDDDFYLAMDLMLAELGDDHSQFESPQRADESQAAYAGDNDYVGIGIVWNALPEVGRGVIVTTFPGGPADEAGLRPHDSILALNGEGLFDADGYLNDRALHGPQGAPLTLRVAHPGGRPFEAALTLRRITGPLPIDFCLIPGPRIGYLFLPGLDDRTLPRQMRQALELMAAAGPLTGLVLDNRQNPGGESTVLEDVLGLFPHGRLGYFVSRHDQYPLEIQARDVGGSQTVPLVVLVDVDTASFGEVLSGVLHATGRAQVVGQTTPGNVEILWGYDLDGGSRAWIAHDRFQPLDQPPGIWEDTGIVPDVFAPTRWDLFTEATDPALAVAVELLSQP